MTRSRIAVALLLLLALWFTGLESRKLIRPDEGRYAELAREMAVSGDWLTPRLNGLKYFEKPPLQYWATASAYTVFGLHHWTARLWSALTGLIGIAIVFAIARILHGTRAAIAAAAILGSSLWYFAIAHLNTLDMGLTCFMTLTLAGFLYAERTEATARQRFAGMMIAWTGMALATLSKGLIGIVLPAGALFLYSLWQLDARVWLRARPGYGLLLYMAICAPWFVAVSLRNPEFAPFFFFHEHLARFISTTHRREGAPWYFVPYLLVGLAPWTVLLASRLRELAALARVRKPFHPERLLIAWCALIFAFFSLSGSKLPSYILPMLPALALLAAPAVLRASERAYALNLVAALLLAGVCAYAIVNADQFASAEVPAGLLRDMRPWIALSAFVIVVAAALAWHSRRRADGNTALTPLLVTAVGALLAWQSGTLGYDALSPATSSYHLVQRIVAKEGPFAPHLPFFSVQTYEQTMPFYLNRTMTLVDFHDEMKLGLELEPDKGIETLPQFHDRWGALDRGYATMDPGTHALLVSEGLPMRELGRDTRRVIVSRR